MTNNDWRHQAHCATAEIDFFDFKSYRDKAAAKTLCMDCPVRMLCLQDALTNEDKFGMWGGVDEQEIRRALAVDKNGYPETRRLPPRCPNCKNETLAVLEKRRTKSRVRCNSCRLVWWTRRTITRRQRSEA